MMRDLFGVCGLAWVLALFVGCATVPLALHPDEAGLRVLSFSVERDVRLGGANGIPEDKPGWISTSRSTYDDFLLEGLARAWEAFPDQVAEVFDVSAQGPGDPDAHPGWTALSLGPVSEADFIPYRARGYYWPEGFRFVDPLEALPLAVAQEFEGALLVTVEYRAFAEDKGDTTQSSSPDFRLGLLARFRVYGQGGELLASHTVQGLSDTAVPRRGGRIDRSAYPWLMVEAQRDALKAWSRLVTFRKET